MNSLVQSALKSWKTTLAGLIIVAGAVVSTFFPEHNDVYQKLLAAAAGFGLVAARDGNVTSEQSGAKR